MKMLGFKRTALLLIMVIGGMRVTAQQLDAEVPGDNFSLEGALELFKKSASPEEFERNLNSADSKVNNLDLNGDGYIDYIRVIDRNEGNVHAFILQALISDNESQDVAVIELEKLANGKAVLQITGDADIYGIETIIEPTEEVRINAGTTVTRRVVNVWAWPSVQYIYSPYYTTVWVSPWYWSYRPVWYRPWRPVAYYVYSPWWRPYRTHYAVCYTHRVTYAHHLYRPYRSTSVIVYNRHHDRIRTYRSARHDYDHNGHYKYADRRSSRSNESRYTDGRSTGRQYESRTTTTYNRQNDTRKNYADVNSRTSNDRRSQSYSGSDYAKRERGSSKPTAKRNDFSTMNRSHAIDQNKSRDVNQRTTSQRNFDSSKKWSGNGTSGASRSQSTHSNSGGSKPQVNRSSPPERKSSGGRSTDRGPGNSGSQKSKSKRGGN